ncbi:hypothetical protein KY363_03580 [Candidatus Woesearchaeota archaeon]|nr:hypothetical protein [Candidatus Woesearchaeota archaeon]
MRTTAILAIIIISALLIGCAKTEITTAGNTAKPTKTVQPADTSEKTYTVQEAKGDAGSTYTVRDGSDSSTEVERQVAVDTTGGDSVSIQKRTTKRRTASYT